MDYFHGLAPNDVVRLLPPYVRNNDWFQNKSQIHYNRNPKLSCPICGKGSKMPDLYHEYTKGIVGTRFIRFVRRVSKDEWISVQCIENPDFDIWVHMATGQPRMSERQALHHYVTNGDEIIKCTLGEAWEEEDPFTKTVNLRRHSCQCQWLNNKTKVEIDVVLEKLVDDNKSHTIHAIGPDVLQKQIGPASSILRRLLPPSS